jgi:hypothetical protein
LIVHPDRLRDNKLAMIQLDHLVVAATTLADGIEFVRQTLGETCVPGGQHRSMGTHNALLSLGDVYVEVIAIDPAVAAPLRPRWFSLDDPTMQHRLSTGPQLIHWVARTRDISHLSKAPVIDMQRSPYHWRITVHDDGQLPAGGVVPTLIQWQQGGHPLAVLPDSGLRLRQLRLQHPNQGLFTKVMARFPFDDERIVVGTGPSIRIQAEIETPAGLVLL